ncbi:DNA polymerase III subunit epsilon [Buchnera aphidicola (Macrosiphoniella sanborni)]|uniref:DNA polymerase III subunit epsilon n=1 Tax=Buchnera aphidicola (Macrosiphoniella sanborni) TaxID=1241865 RepID=A0A4D6YCV7_9GAMM|nr:DNA polymerase III subunit epsilon [Buchnera aphidicola]QCI23794.1 DNA polymerase III subunit epsilon [Buchnera aphidicola (Macrosiphoniella sanborni)]
MNTKRIIILDTETTGINKINLPHINHRIIEIGAVEIINRRFTGNNFHVYIQPDRQIESEALKVHGITNNFLKDKPFFKDIVDKFLKYIKNSILVIHNAPFDVGFINQELKILNQNIQKIDTLCSIVDTLKIARKLFPGKKNTLDALCTRYKINKSHRNLHSAIVDAYLLGKLYLLMTGGQESMCFDGIVNNQKISQTFKKFIRPDNISLKILYAKKQEIDLHIKYLKHMQNKNLCLWKYFFL